MKVAVEERAVHEEAHQQLTQVTPPGAIEEWIKAVEEWEKNPDVRDPNAKNPYSFRVSRKS